MSTDEYVLPEEHFRDYYVGGRSEYDPNSPSDDTTRADWDAFLARVRRDAAREALDGYTAAEEDSFLRLHVKEAPIAAAQCTHAATTAREYRDTHYPIPEETP